MTTYQLAHSAATDIANEQMRGNRRSAWSMDDYNLACRTLARLYPKCGANPKAGLANDPKLTRLTGDRAAYAARSLRIGGKT